MHSALLTELDHLYALETASYPEDEAASLHSMEYRLENANDYFQVYAQNDSAIVGFVNGTLIPTSYITHESMHSHDPNGNHLIIHSVTIDPKYRRLKLGFTMLREYVDLMIKKTDVHRISLLSKEYLLEFYKSCGFEVIGLSAVVHGSESWYDLTMDLTALRQ